MSTKLAAALKGVDWQKNVDTLLNWTDVAGRIEQCNMTLAVWARQIELIENSNPAISFIREMQHGGHNVACCIGLALYKPAASAMRSLLECTLYYTYFRTHVVELATLVRDSQFYVTKKEILSFYAEHVPEFKNRQSALGYSAQLELWYSKTSAIVHGQIPGQWVSTSQVAGLQHDKTILLEVVTHFEAAVSLVRNTFLCVLAPELWKFFEKDAKESLSKGLTGPVKTALLLDKA